MPQTDKSMLLDAVHSRKSRSGIVTADRYFRDVQGCFDGGVCPPHVSGYSPEEWDAKLKEAESILTYTNPEMTIVDKSFAKSTGSALLEFNAIITTPFRDRDGDVLKTKGASVDKNMSLLMYHNPMMTVGPLVKVIQHTDKLLEGRFAIADTVLGRDAAKLVELKALRISHGFDPEDWEPMDDEKGWIFHKFSIFEVSLVSIPSNVQAVITAVAEKHFESEFGKQWQQSVLKQAGNSPIVLKSECSCGGKQKELFEEVSVNTASQVEILKSIKKSFADQPEFTKEFDVERQHVEASKLEYDWVSRFCSCEVKQLVNFGTHVSRIYMGSFLTGMKHALKDSSELDVRRLTGKGLESPPNYEVVQLNSKLSDHFLTDGISFRKTADGTCFAVKFERTWSGEYTELFCSRKDEEKIGGILSKAWEWSQENNFLKGEAFSLDGEFLGKTDEDWGDLFLDTENEKEVKRSVDLMNSKGSNCPNRGQIYMGPPGTGKTLSGRLIKNKVNATFIWVGGKQAYYYGGTNAVLQAFELAKDLAPAVIFMEDIDASLHSGHAIDVLKTEMDGIGRSSGILTVLTTNHPKSFPEALLDRPGRFHDVLKFDLPSGDIRLKMMRKWLPDAEEKTLLDTVKDTDGYSGAHVYELCQYAKNLQEQDEIGIDSALTKAMKKIHDQRELIDQELMRDRNISSRKRHFETAHTKSGAIVKSIGDAKRLIEKAGSRISATTRSELSEAMQDIQAIAETGDLPRGVVALANSAMNCIQGLLGSEDEEKSFAEVEKAYFAELVKSDFEKLNSAHRRLSLMLSASKEKQEAREWDDVLSLFT